MKQYTYLFALFLLALLGATACTDELDNVRKTEKVKTVEGLEGTLSLTIGSYEFESRESSLTRANASGAEDDEQNLYSLYIFVIDMKNENTGIESCPIIARKYIPNVTDKIEEVTESNKTWTTINLSMKALSCNRAAIFAIANLGHSEMQHIENDAQLLDKCDSTQTLGDLQALTARLAIKDGLVNVERTQGHHLMSGFYADFSDEKNIHYLKTDKMRIALVKEDDALSIYNSDDNQQRFRPLGSSGSGTPGAIIMHRLDAKVTFNIQSAGALETTEGAYFHLNSWQVKNIPVEEKIHWVDEGLHYSYITKESKVVKRGISETEEGGYTFSFYQFENCATESLNPGDTEHGYNLINEGEIAIEYNREYGRTIKAEDIIAAFSSYPNLYSQFAYSLRDRNEKEGYNPDTDDDKTVIVTNGQFDHAPKTATYVVLTGEYYNPQEPLRRRKDDVLNDNFPKHSLAEYPYWGENNTPVATEEEAAKQARAAQVTYYIHLGYVGGGNFERSTNEVPATITSFEQYMKKVNDYNILRNNHYIYTVQIAGVNNIKVEATREGGGNIYEQEKQPGAEGTVLESKCFFDLDAHYETRNLTIDFEKMPKGYTNYGFMLSTPYQNIRAEMRLKSDGTYGIFNKNTNAEMVGIHGLDLDWIHFAWHGTEDEPNRSLIDANTGNGISYSETYGGYTDQDSYNDPTKKLLHEKDATHLYYLMNANEFIQHVWIHYQSWLAKGKPADQKTMTYTLYVDEFYYDNNPATGANVDWMSFCGQKKRTAIFFIDNSGISADQNSIYTNSYIVINQHPIQTPFATSTANGQSIADVAFGIEYLDEYKAKYRSHIARNNDLYAEHYFTPITADNGLYNAINWFNKRPGQVITWKEAERYFTEKARVYKTVQADYTDPSHSPDRANRRGGWAIYSRNRDLNRDGKLDANEIRWFVPAGYQYTVCFMGGPPVFDNPLFEVSKTIKAYKEPLVDALRGTPTMHYLTNSSNCRVFWSEEGCTLGPNYNEHGTSGSYGIRMARMLCRNGIDDTGSAFNSSSGPTQLQQDLLFIISETRNGVAITDHSQLVDGKNYYITLNKLNPSAFREYVASGDLSQHGYTQKNNWLNRQFKIAKHKIGYTSYTNPTTYDRTPKIDGIPLSWWRMNGVWSPAEVNSLARDFYFYNGPTTTIAYEYSEEADRNDLHRWRIPNLREAAIMSKIFPESWFGGADANISERSRAENLGPNSTKIPYWIIGAGRIIRNGTAIRSKQYVRAVHDVQ